MMSDMPDEMFIGRNVLTHNGETVYPKYKAIVTNFGQNMHRYIRADLVPQCPAGYVMVPVEPTDAMCTAGSYDNIGLLLTRSYYIYKAMIAARPKGGE